MKKAITFSLLNIITHLVFFLSAYFTGVLSTLIKSDFLNYVSSIAVCGFICCLMVMLFEKILYRENGQKIEADFSNYILILLISDILFTGVIAFYTVLKLNQPLFIIAFCLIILILLLFLFRLYDKLFNKKQPFFKPALIISSVSALYFMFFGYILAPNLTVTDEYQLLWELANKQLLLTFFYISIAVAAFYGIIMFLIEVYIRAKAKIYYLKENKKRGIR